MYFIAATDAARQGKAGAFGLSAAAVHQVGFSAIRAAVIAIYLGLCNRGLEICVLPQMLCNEVLKKLATLKQTPQNYLLAKP